MSTSQLDRIVKGAPPPHVSLDQVASAARRSSSTPSVTAPHPPPQSTTPQHSHSHSHSQSDPLTNLPSSPEQIKLNLLILESSLRAQYLSLRARLRLYLVLMAALALWILSFTYLLFLRPREDGKGTGGSPYWVLDMAERLGWGGGLVTAGLVWGTGMWDRGIRWPRRWVAITNRGLRGFNLKLVIIRGPWWSEALGYLALLDPCRWWGDVRGIRFEFMPKDIEKADTKDKLALWESGGRYGWIEEDVAPGGDVIKLLLLPKPFSPDFREDWDTYRSTYWEKENDRRVQLRAILKARNRQLARQYGGWLWWTGWRGWNRLRSPPKPQYQQHQQHQHHQPPNRLRRESLRDKPSSSQLREKKARPGVLRDTSQSRSSSRGSTSDDKMRRGSSSQGVPRKKRPQPTDNPSSASLERRSSRLADSRPSTPGSTTGTVSDEFPLHNRASSLSMSSTWSNDVIKEDTPPTDTDTRGKEDRATKA